mmetsp:Transcript_21448/g.23886  ORF Transcript_21448/g.23886 Transcript_21448/m.23886 type:complete len:137 (-) Transcript_21448:40-450(-)
MFLFFLIFFAGFIFPSLYIGGIILAQTESWSLHPRPNGMNEGQALIPNAQNQMYPNERNGPYMNPNSFPNNNPQSILYSPAQNIPSYHVPTGIQPNLPHHQPLQPTLNFTRTEEAFIPHAPVEIDQKGNPKEGFEV